MPVNMKLKASDLFDKLRPERKQDVKKIKIERSPALDAIVNGFKKAVESEYHYYNSYNEFYEICTRHVPEKYSAKDIEYFSILLSGYQSEEDFEYKAGLYLSALTNCCKDENVTIRTHITDGLIGLIGYRNEDKHVTVKGNVGYHVGSHMKSGAIHVEGNAGNDVGLGMKSGAIHVEGNAGDSVGWDMEGGAIHVEGNAGDYVGFNMEGGAIHVEGNAGKKVGQFMKSGEIYINGELKSLAENTEGGNIYHKGKLIVKDGKRIK